MPSPLNPNFIVFLIDNDPSVYESLLRLGDLSDRELLFFPSVPDLVGALQRRMPGCLIIEANLKPLGGVQLYKKLIADKLAPPTVFITTTGTVPEAVEVMQLGAIDYIEKPVIHARLVAAIKKPMALIRA